MYTYFHSNFWVTFGMQIFSCISDNFLIYVKQIIRMTLTLQQCHACLFKMSFKNHSHQKFPKGIIHWAKAYVSRTTTGFIWLCFWQFADFASKSSKSSICHCNTRFVHQKFAKTTPKISWRNNLPSQVECLQYNNRLHMTLYFINFSRHSIIADRAHGTGLIILTQNNSQHCNTSYCWVYISQ